MQAKYMEENMNDPIELLNILNDNLNRFSKEWNKQTTAFFSLMNSIESDGALSSKIKEIIVIGISIAVKCEWCIDYHVKSALDKGATKEEIMEASWVAVLMGGGPSLMYTQYVQNALDKFAK
jgi:AhpD family alkylhydroperoxidase